MLIWGAAAVRLDRGRMDAVDKTVPEGKIIAGAPEPVLVGSVCPVQWTVQ